MWDLYARALELTGPQPTLIERDDAIPPLPELLAACRAELDRFLEGSPRRDDLTLVAVRRAA